jgi:hypothetical protein
VNANLLRSLCVLLLTANIGMALWLRFMPDEVQYAKPVTDPDVPGLILRQEYLKLERSERRLQASACWLIGPFASQKHMQDAWQSLEYVALDMQRRKTVQSLHQGYEVRIPPSASKADAESLAELLVSAGVVRPQVIEDGASAHAVSMGRFSELAEAERIQKLAQKLGLEAVLTSVQTDVTQWRIEATVLNQAGFERWLIELSPKVPAQPCGAPDPASQNPPTQVQ